MKMFEIFETFGKITLTDRRQLLPKIVKIVWDDSRTTNAPFYHQIDRLPQTLDTELRAEIGDRLQGDRNNHIKSTRTSAPLFSCSILALVWLSPIAVSPDP